MLLCSSSDILAISHLLTVFRNRYFNPLFISTFTGTQQIIENYMLFKIVYRKTVPSSTWRILDDLIEEIVTIHDITENSERFSIQLQQLKKDTTFSLECQVYFD